MDSLDPEKNEMAAVEISATESPSSSIHHSADEFAKPASPPRQWRPTLLQFGPLSGIFCLLLAMASIVASLGILAGSDGRSVHNWTSPVSTYLAIWTAIANLSMRYAAFQGVVITWWLSASNGAPLAKLHWNWKAGTTLRGALTSGRHLGFVGIGCIFSTLVAVDGPLLQRASTVISKPYHDQSVHLNVSMAMEIPSSFTGSWTTAKVEGLPGTHWSQAFNSTVPTNNGDAPNSIWPSNDGPYWYPGFYRAQKSWFGDKPLAGIVSGCPGSCRAQIEAPALFPTNCTTHTVPLDFNSQIRIADWSAGTTAAPLNADVMMIDTALLLGERESINLVTGYATTTGPNCTGVFTYKICTLESAVGLYDLEIRNNEVKMETVHPPTLVALANNTAVNHTWVEEYYGYPSTLAGIVSFMYTRWTAMAFYYKRPNSTAIQAVTAGAPITQFELPENSVCPSWSDPHDTVIESINKLMLYIGAAAAQEPVSYLKTNMDPDLPVNRTVIGYLQGDHNVFHTTYWYFLAAALIEIACVAAIIPTYWNFWKLGRPVSLSPLEIAKAFESPILAECNSNSTGRELARCVGDSVVKYGATRHGSNGRARLALASPSVIHPSTKGETFDR